MSKNLNSDVIFKTLNQLKQLVGLAVSDFLNNQVKRNKAIENMEVRFSDINLILDSYFTTKKVLNNE